MRKFILLVVLLCSLIVLLTSATPNEVSVKNTENSTSYLSSIRLAQARKQFAEMPNEKAYNVSQGSDGAEPMTPLSVNPVSGCVFSACGGSGCLGSACGGSGCVGSGCGGSACGASACGSSACAGSGCGSSACVGSACAGSACGGSLCGGSLCGGSVCAGSLCGGSTCVISYCIGSDCVGTSNCK